MENIALYGGAFDPIHNGHLHLADEFVRRLSLRELILMPTAQSPHKTNPFSAAAVHRLAMCRLAAEGHPNISVSDMEIRRGGKSYTVDTLRTLKEMYPVATIYLIMGADMFLTMEQWRLFEEILSLCILCPVVRDSAPREALEQKARALEAHDAVVRFEDILPMEVSSTDVRRRIQGGRPVSDLVPAPVAQYMTEHHLYLP